MIHTKFSVAPQAFYNLKLKDRLQHSEILEVTAQSWAVYEIYAVLYSFLDALPELVLCVHPDMNAWLSTMVTGTLKISVAGIQ